MNTQGHAWEREGPQLFTLDEVAARLRCSRRYVEELISKGHLQAVRMGSKLIRVTRDMLAAYCSSLPRVLQGAA